MEAGEGAVLAVRDRARAAHTVVPSLARRIPVPLVIHLTLEVSMQKWACTLCDYVYDPAVGDPDGDIPPGTAFEDLPEDWECPTCGAAKDMFEPVEE